MAERVEIVVVAQDAASQALRGITSNFGALGAMVESFQSGRVVEDLTAQIVKFGKESVTATIDYANEVRALTLISGESAEETSRFIQVLDDFKIGTESVMTATRTLTKEGLAPNLETLAQLSDEYLTITDAQEKNEFVIKNLGREGLKWVEILNKGGDAIRAMGADVDDMLIFSQEQLDKTRELEISMDIWGESIQGLQYQIGTELIPILAEGVDWIMAWDEAMMRAGGTGFGFGKAFVQALYDVRNEQRANKDMMLQSKEAERLLTEERKKSEEQLKAEEEALKALSKANEEYLNLVGSLADNLTSYEQKHNDIQRELDEGNITLEEAERQWRELANEQEKATYRMVLNMLQQRLAIDGLDAAETQFLLDQGVQWGIYSQKAVNEANAIIRNVDNLVAEYNSIPRTVQTDIITNHITMFGSGSAGSGPGTGNHGNRAGGGNALAGALYKVNETRTEYFQPAQSGTVIPLGAGGGSGAGVVVHYSPMISLGDRREAETILLPMIEDAVRRMQSDGRVAL